MPYEHEDANSQIVPLPTNLWTFVTWKTSKITVIAYADFHSFASDIKLRSGQLYAVPAVSRLIIFKLNYIGGHWQIETEKTFL